ncbi:MAG: hypothetical protein WAL34_04000 [Acidobacteriaceae bacterium]
MRVLVVKSDFKGHTRGSRITDPAEIEAILKSPDRARVVAADHPADSVEAHA